MNESIDTLSLLETYEVDNDANADIIIVENPEIFLHPKLQKISGENPVPSFQAESGDFFHTFSKSSSKL